MIRSCSGIARTAVLNLLLLVAMPSFAAPQDQWLLVARTSGGDLSIGRQSVGMVSKDVVSAWARHRDRDGVRHLERYEVNCSNRQRRLLETWHRPESADTAPTAHRAAGWTPTEPNTTMRELVVGVCALWNRSRD